MSRQNYKNTTKQVRVSPSLHKRLKVRAAQLGISIKKLLGDCINEYL